MIEKQELTRVFTDYLVAALKKVHQKTDDGAHGWNDLDYKESMKEELQKNVDKGDWLDVANFAVFLWNLKR